MSHGISSSDSTATQRETTARKPSNNYTTHNSRAGEEMQVVLGSINVADAQNGHGNVRTQLCELYGHASLDRGYAPSGNLALSLMKPIRK